MSQNEIIEAMKRLEQQYGIEMFFPYCEIKKEVDKLDGNIQSSMIKALLTKRELERTRGLWIYDTGYKYNNQTLYRRIKPT